jgi:RimJ/RimL family protein N-acetyltransferase
MRVLTTDRLLLRDFTTEDVAAVHAYAADPEVCRFVEWGPNTEHQTRQFVTEMVAAASRPDRTSFTWAITTGGAVVGACSISVTSAAHRRGELGYVLARAHWGLGYATEAASAVLAFGRDGLGLHRVEATCRPGNVASQRVLRKLGMQQEGVLRSHMLIRGRREDSLLFATVSDTS